MIRSQATRISLIAALSADVGVALNPILRDWGEAARGFFKSKVFLRGFERRREVPLGRNSTLQLFHGSPNAGFPPMILPINRSLVGASGRAD